MCRGSTGSPKDRSSLSLSAAPPRLAGSARRTPSYSAPSRIGVIEIAAISPITALRLLSSLNRPRASRSASRVPPQIMDGEQHPALEDELVGEPRLGQAGQEALVDVKLEEMLRVAALVAGELLQIEVGPLGRAVGHASRGSIASAMTEPTRSLRASASSSPGLASLPWR